MNFYVCVKHVPDTEAKIVPKSDKELDLSSVKWIISPFDEYAVEEAVATAKKNEGSEVIIVTAGPATAKNTIKQALAMGGHRAIHIVCDPTDDHGHTAQMLANAIKNDGEPSLIFTGKQASDDDAYQVHLRMAHRLGASCSTNVVAFEFDGKTAKVTREIDDGASEKLELTLPAVIAASKGLNEPRYPTLPNIMKAKKKAIAEVTLESLGIDLASERIEVLEQKLPPEKSGGEILEGTNEENVSKLVNILVSERKVVF